MGESGHRPIYPLHGVLLDVDGTLVDSNDAHAHAWVEAFSAYGYPVPFPRIRRLIGKGGDKLIRETTGIDPDSPMGQAIPKRRLEIFMTKYVSSLRPCRGARALLERLRGDGLRLVIASSAKDAELHALLERAAVADLIDEAATSDDAERSKPDPDIVCAALHRGRLDSTRAVMIGDTPYDVEAAAKAGVPIVGVRCGGWDDPALDGAIAIYDDPQHILQHYDTSPFVAPSRREAGRRMSGDGPYDDQRV